MSECTSRYVTIVIQFINIMSDSRDSSDEGEEESEVEEGGEEGEESVKEKKEEEEEGKPGGLLDAEDEVMEVETKTEKPSEKQSMSLCNPPWQSGVE